MKVWMRLGLRLRLTMRVRLVLRLRMMMRLWMRVRMGMEKDRRNCRHGRRRPIVLAIAVAVVDAFAVVVASLSVSIVVRSIFALCLKCRLIQAVTLHNGAR